MSQPIPSAPFWKWDRVEVHQVRTGDSLYLSSTTVDLFQIIHGHTSCQEEIEKWSSSRGLLLCGGCPSFFKDFVSSPWLRFYERIYTSVSSFPFLFLPWQVLSREVEYGFNQSNKYSHHNYCWAHGGTTFRIRNNCIIHCVSFHYIFDLWDIVIEFMINSLRERVVPGHIDPKHTVVLSLLNSQG